MDWSVIDHPIEGDWSCECRRTDEDVHRLGCRADDHADDNESSTDESNVSTTHQIGEGAHERADSRKCKEIGKNLDMSVMRGGREEFVDGLQTRPIYPPRQCHHR